MSERVEPEQPAGEPTSKPSDEELMRQVEEELRKLKVSDLLVQTLYTISSLGYRKLSEEDRDLDQAKLAIEALRALVPVLEGTIGDDVIRDFRQVTANLQLAYADAATGGPRSGLSEERTGEGGSGEPGVSPDE
jgi:hypothetical protein